MLTINSYQSGCGQWELEIQRYFTQGSLFRNNFKSCLGQLQIFILYSTRYSYKHAIWVHAVLWNVEKTLHFQIRQQSQGAFILFLLHMHTPPSPLMVNMACLLIPVSICFNNLRFVMNYGLMNLRHQVEININSSNSAEKT